MESLPLIQHLDILQEQSQRLCGFAHEQSELEDPPQCHQKCLACPHDDTLALSITAALNARAITADDAETYRGVVNECMLHLLRADVDAATHYTRMHELGNKAPLPQDVLTVQSECHQKLGWVREQLLLAMRKGILS